VGVYIPPNETNGTMLSKLEVALQGAERDMEILHTGNINMDLSEPGETVRDIEVCTVLSSFGLQDLTRHFWQQTQHRHR
jgi:hypothetical protein